VGHPELPAERWEGASTAEWRAAWNVPALYLYRRVGSTNDVARRLAEHGAPPGTVVLADEQTAGRGRAGRTWLAPPGRALLLSILLRPGARAPLAAPLLAGLATARAIERTTGVRTGIKWPNDIVVEGKKLAGILCETAAGPGPDYLVVGIGINVLQEEDDWPPELRAHATSLRLLTGRAIPRGPLAGALIAETRALVGDTPALTPALRRELEARDTLRGRPVLVDGRPAGTALGITGEGALLVRTPAGTTARIRSGTVRAGGPRTSAPDPEP